MEAKFQKLSESMEHVHRRLDILEKQVEILPEKIRIALGPNTQLFEGSQVFNLVVQTLTSTILQSVTSSLQDQMKEMIQSTTCINNPINAAQGKSNGVSIIAPRLNIDNTYNTVPMHHISSKSPVSTRSDDSPSNKALNIKQPTSQHEILRAPAILSSLSYIQSTHEEQSPSKLRIQGKEFIWPDGSKRRTPHQWQFPLLSFREIWRCWFYGDRENQIGPFRLLKSRDVTQTNCVKNMSNARVVINNLITTAIENGIIESSESLDSMMLTDCMQVFDQSFDIFAGKCDDGHYTREGFERLRPEEASTVKYSSVYERQRKRRRIEPHADKS